jgi:hypothetical protein
MLNAAPDKTEIQNYRCTKALTPHKLALRYLIMSNECMPYHISYPPKQAGLALVVEAMSAALCCVSPDNVRWKR